MKNTAKEAKETANKTITEREETKNMNKENTTNRKEVENMKTANKETATEIKEVSKKMISDKNDNYCELLRLALTKSIKCKNVTIKEAKDTIRVYHNKTKVIDCFNRKCGLAIHTVHDNDIISALDKLECVTDVVKLDKYISAYLIGNKLQDFVKFINEYTKALDSNAKEATIQV